jgi:hypothetical protein
VPAALADPAAPPALVTVHVWRIPAISVPAALTRIGPDRLALRRAPGLRFGKLLGTARGSSLSGRRADLRRWALVASWDDPDAPDVSGTLAAWERIADEHWRLDLQPLAARGHWARRQPFGDPTPARWTGPVAALTRARLTVRGAREFWRAVPAVEADLAGSDGLLATVGIGEAPFGWQGTLSVWRDQAALRAFAYAGRAHAAVVERTPAARWYAEELFARFGVLRSVGTVNGMDPLRCN